MLVIALGNTQHFTIKSFKCCIYRVLLFVLKIYLKTFSFTNLFLLIISLNVSSIQGVYQTRRHFPFIFPTSLYAQHIWKTEKRLMVMMIILLFIISHYEHLPLLTTHLEKVIFIIIITFWYINHHHHHSHHHHRGHENKFPIQWKWQPSSNKSPSVTISANFIVPCFWCLSSAS